MRSVLVIDPDLDALAELASGLRERGLTVVVADGVEAAEERVRRSRPDVVVLAPALREAMEAARTAGSEVASLPTVILGEGPDSLPVDSARGGEADLVARRVLGLVARRAAVAVDRGDFRGTLAQVALPDLLQLLGMNRRTGTLAVSTAGGAAEVHLVEGEVFDVVFRRLEGEKALFRLLGEVDGTFAFASGPPLTQRRVQSSTGMLLMEGLRQLDELRAAVATLALGGDAVVGVMPPEAARDSAAERVVLTALVAPQSLDELLDAVPLPDLEAVRALSALLDSGRALRVPRGAERVELGDHEQLTLLASLVRRRTRGGFEGRPRMVVVASPERLGLVSHAVRRLAEAVVPAGLAGPGPAPRQLAVLRLGEGVELELVGVSSLDAFAPLWALALPGAVVALQLDGTGPLLSERCAQHGIPLVDAGPGVRELGGGDPAELAALLRRGFEAMGA